VQLVDTLGPYIYTYRIKRRPSNTGMDCGILEKGSSGIMVNSAISGQKGNFLLIRNGRRALREISAYLI
jgi:hypothetical protein